MIHQLQEVRLWWNLVSVRIGILDPCVLCNSLGPGIKFCLTRIDFDKRVHFHQNLLSVLKTGMFDSFDACLKQDETLILIENHEEWRNTFEELFTQHNKNHQTQEFFQMSLTSRAHSHSTLQEKGDVLHTLPHDSQH